MNKYIIFIICLYVYFHNPDIPYLPFGLGTIKLLYIPVLLFLLHKNKQFRDYISFFKPERKVLLFVFIYVIIRTLMGGDALEIRLHFFGFVEIFFVPLSLLVIAQKVGLSDKVKLVKSILGVGAIGAVISTITSVFPEMQEYIRNNFMHLKQDSYLLEATWRGRGISEALTSHYGYIQGCMVVLAAYYYKSNKWYFWLIPFTVISVIYNARTGIVIMLAGLLLLMLYGKNLKFSMLLIIAGAFIFYNLESLGNIIGISDELYGSLSRFGDSFNAISESGEIDEDSGAIYALLVEMWILPSTLTEWIFGRGFSLYGMKDVLGFSSDVGFINNLSYGGLIYMVMMYSFLYIMLKRLWRLNEKRFFYFLIILFFIINIKTWFFPNSGTTRLMMLMYFFFVLFDSKKLVIDTNTSQINEKYCSSDKRVLS